MPLQSYHQSFYLTGRRPSWGVSISTHQTLNYVDYSVAHDTLSIFIHIS